MAKANIAELALELGRQMAEMKNYLRQYIQVKIKENDLNITFELLEIMSLLWTKDGINQQELAAVAVRDKSSITYLIDNLVKRNLVTRIEDQNDRRNKIIYLTKEGKQLHKQVYPWVIEMYAKATGNVEATEIGEAMGLIKKMNQNLKEQTIIKAGK